MQEYSVRTRRAEAEQNRRIEALKSWGESEWVLSCLRTHSATPLKALTDEEIYAWYEKTNPQEAL